MLQAELARRCTNNAQYSLRAFAKFLGVDHSTLSQVLRGKRPLTSRSVRKFAARLGFAAEDIERWITCEERLARLPDDDVIHEVRRLAQDTASLIADWHHYAILELIHVNDFKPDSRWIARVLGISVDEVNVAAQRLLRLGLLEMTGQDRWIDHLGDARTSIKGFAQAAAERFLQQVRRLTLSALRDLPEGSFEYGATTMAIDTARLPEAFAVIERMRKEILAVLAKGAKRDDVYQLEIVLVPITQLKQQEKPDGQPRHALANRDQKP